MVNKTEHIFKEKTTAGMCKQYGLIVGALWSVSFILAMNAGHSIFYSQLCNLLGISSVVIAGSTLREYSRSVSRLSFRNAWCMSLYIYGCAVLITAACQFLYFRFFDNGHLSNILFELFQSPDYTKMLEQMNPDSDVKTLKKSLEELILSPKRMTLQLMWMNIILSLILSIPTAIIGIVGQNRNNNK